MIRTGLGWDRHPFAPGRRCILGGVEFPELDRGPAGHSDGDAVCHAVIDALLGAAALGDIGQHFPDTDPQWQDADSVEMLREVVMILDEHGWRVMNIDTTVVTEEPLIAPRTKEMRRRLAEALSVPIGSVSVKATRGEGLGPEGRKECVTCLAIALIGAQTTPASWGRTGP